jgi:tRNA (guanine-N7-)-methyltransferase
MTDSDLSRRIRSFVIRTGRMTDSQKAGWDSGFTKHGFTLSDNQFDWNLSFDVAGPRVLEIGFGMGDSLVAMAEQNPESRYLGIEVHTPGVGKLLADVERLGIRNLKVFSDDAVQVLEDVIPGNSVDLMQIFFPDPWHKKRHHKRRLIQPDFVNLVVSRLSSGGHLHLATDWEPYAEHMMDVLSATEALANVAGDRQFSPRPESRPETKFERRGHRLGHGVWDLLFTKG